MFKWFYYNYIDQQQACEVIMASRCIELEYLWGCATPIFAALHLAIIECTINMFLNTVSKFIKQIKEWITHPLL